MGFLRGYRGALLVISHDLDLLDEAITRVLHLDRPDETRRRRGHRVQGHVHASTSEARAADEERPQPRTAARQAKEIARLQRFVDRFGAKATKAAAAHSMEKRIARLETDKVDEVRAERVLRVKFPPPPTPGRTVIEVSGMTKSYGGPTVFRTSRSTSAAVSGCSCSGSTAPARRACCASSPARPRPTAAASSGATTSPSATTPRSTTTCAATNRCSTTSGARCRRASS